MSAACTTGVHNDKWVITSARPEAVLRCSGQHLLTSSAAPSTVKLPRAFPKSWPSPRTQGHVRRGADGAGGEAGRDPGGAPAARGAAAAVCHGRRGQPIREHRCCFAVLVFFCDFNAPFRCCGGLKTVSLQTGTRSATSGHDTLSRVDACFFVGTPAHHLSCSPLVMRAAV